MAYKWLGMKMLSWEEVNELHERNKLAGCYKLYPDGTEGQIGSDYSWKDIERHYEKGGGFGEDLPTVELKLPDGKKIKVPEVVDISGVGILDEQEYSLWNTIEEYLILFGIRTEDDLPDWATVKVVQDKLLDVLSEAGVNFKFLTDEQSMEIEKAIKGKAKEESLKVELKVKVTQQDIDDIVCGALEGGINYWCYKAEVVEDKYLGEYASDQISRGGSLRLYDAEENTVHLLTKEKFLKGLQMYIQNPHPYDITEGTKDGLEIDACQADAGVCDMIIQYAIFGEIVYG